MPHVRLRAMQADEHLFDYLREDLLDLVFFARQGLHPDVHSVALLTTPYVCLVRRGHPLSERAAALGPLEREDLEAFPQVLINAQPDRYRAPNSPGNGWFNPKKSRPHRTGDALLSCGITLSGRDGLLRDCAQGNG